MPWPRPPHHLCCLSACGLAAVLNETDRHKRQYSSNFGLLSDAAAPSITVVFSMLAKPLLCALGLPSDSHGRVVLVWKDTSTETEHALTLALLNSDDISLPCDPQGGEVFDEALRVAILRCLNLRRTWLKSNKPVKDLVALLDVWARANVRSVLDWLYESLVVGSPTAAPQERVLRLQHPETHAATSGGQLAIQSLLENNRPRSRSTAQVETSRTRERAT